LLPFSFAVLSENRRDGCEEVSVAKTAMICPFSKIRCKECAVYRGRHVALCSAAGYRGDPLWTVRESRLKPTNGSTNFKIDVPDLPDCSMRLKDVEDFGC
jgi:hypothetical protein